MTKAPVISLPAEPSLILVVFCFPREFKIFNTLRVVGRSFGSSTQHQLINFCNSGGHLSAPGNCGYIAFALAETIQHYHRLDKGGHTYFQERHAHENKGRTRQIPNSRYPLVCRNSLFSFLGPRHGAPQVPYLSG